MKRHLIILPRRNFSEEDLFNFLDIIKGKIYIATINREIAYGNYKSLVYPDFSIEEIFKMSSNPFDSIIFIADKGYKDLIIPEVKALFARFLNLMKPVVLSSLSQVAMAKMGLLYNRIVTFDNVNYPEYEKILLKYGVKVVDSPFYRDNNLISTKGKDSIYLLEEIGILA